MTIQPELNFKCTIKRCKRGLDFNLEFEGINIFGEKMGKDC